ncbi:XapX domain-containing protein [Halobacteriales archaeon QH_8_68_33]|nr:MAG: XapX domain-containing protein [Halobacteriales archaeon QH_1_68_42]PSP90862.1 MAG: XapX domain-containing protein [Halobacteriales archaeon QH_8_68_33]
MTDATVAVLALVTGFLTGAVFRFLNVPIPAPPNVSGVLGIVGIYLGYVVLDYFDMGVDILGYV